MSEPDHVPPRPPHPGPRRWLLPLLSALLAAAVVAFYFWSLHCVSQLRLRERQTDYYNLQVQGWLKGQLAMDVAPHPDLRVEYPNRITQHAPYLLDASYYQGKYYLYFGPVPALVLLLPYRLATGWDIPESLAAAAFASLGFLLSLLWLHRLAGAFFPRAGAGLRLAGIAVLGLANLAPVALARPLFYELAAASGYAFSQACLLAVTLAVLRPERALRWLALASLAAGLAAGSRPNLIVGAALLLPFTVAGLWWRGPHTWPRLLHLLLAGGLPVLGCGLALLAYNHARFDRWLEFGLNLQLGANPQGFGFSARNLWHNLQLYYLTPPVLDWYFPFVGPGPEPARPPGYYGIEELHGQFVLLPVAALAGILALARGLRPGTIDRRLVWILTGAALCAAGNFVLVASSGVRTSRYMLDFQPILLMVLLAVMLASAGDPRRAVRWLARVGTAGLLLAAAYNVLVSFDLGQALHRRDAAAFSVLERGLNRLVAPAQRAFGAAPGPQHWRITFSEDGHNRLEPLLVAGRASDFDGLFIQFLQPNRAQLIFSRHPYGFLTGPEFTYTPGGSADLVLNLGTLFPPVGHPWYGQVSPAAQQRLRHTVSVLLDGRPVLDANAPCGTASLRAAGVGRHWLARDSSRFSGRIEPLAPPPFVPPVIAGRGLSETFEVRLPLGMSGQREPLLGYGVSGPAAGDHVFIEYLAPGSLRFGYDSAGIVAFSPRLLVDYATPHRLAYRFEPSDETTGRPGFVRIQWDGEEVWSAPLVSRPARDAVALPFCHASDFVSLRLFFTGTILSRLGPTLSDAPPARYQLPPASLARGRPGATGPQVLATWQRDDNRTATLALEPRGPDACALVWSEGGVATPALLTGPEATVLALSLQPDASGFSLRSGDTTVLAHKTDFFTAANMRWWVGQAVPPGALRFSEFGGVLRPAWRNRPPETILVPEEGPVELRLRFPADRPGAREPLLVIGATGQADGVYVRYVDSQHVVFGFDHWGVVPPESPPVPLDYRRDHLVWIDYDSLHPDTADRTGRLQIRVDGQVVWTQPVSCHAYAENGPVAGENRIGLSSCGPRFTGVIHGATHGP